MLTIQYLHTCKYTYNLFLFMLLMLKFIYQQTITFDI